MTKENQKEILEKLSEEIINIRDEILDLSITLKTVSNYLSDLTCVIDPRDVSLIHEYFEILFKMISEKAEEIGSMIMDLEIKVDKELKKKENHE